MRVLGVKKAHLSKRGYIMGSSTLIALIIANEIIREGVSRILSDRNFKVIASVPFLHDLSAGDAEELDIVVMALGPNDNVAHASAELANACPQARRVLTATDFRFDDMILACEHAIDGLILSGASSEQFAGFLRLVALGERVLPGKVADYLCGRELVEQPASVSLVQAASGLSHREIDILSHLVDGDANKVIARRLNITEATVKVHVKTILRKLQLANRTQAAIWATRNRVSGAAIRTGENLACA
jgi:two-component system nitrate/nitrite response regulator NarL